MERFVTVALLNFVLVAIGTAVFGEGDVSGIVLAVGLGNVAAMVMMRLFGIVEGAKRDPLNLKNYPDGTSFFRENGRVFVKIPVTTAFMSDFRILEIRMEKVKGALREVSREAIEEFGAIVGFFGQKEIAKWIRTGGRVYHFAGLDMAQTKTPGDLEGILFEGLMYVEDV